MDENEELPLPAIADSGSRQEFSTGSVRDAQVGKGRWDLLPFGALLRVARMYEAGAEKYGDRNWEKGQPVSRFINSALRHTMRYLDGQSDEDHLAMACWNLLGALEMEERAGDRVSGALLDLPRHSE